MAGTFTINLTEQIGLVQILDDYNGASSSVSCPSSLIPADSTDGKRLTMEDRMGDLSVRHAADLERQKTEIAQLFQALKRLVDELNQFYKEMLDKHKEEIASLSVEIANKVLMQKVQKGDYRIESIITEALKNAPTCQDVVVHLNPEDMTQYQKLKQNSIGDTLEGIKFVADPNVGRAECMLDTPKGIIKSFIEQHLEQIKEALAKVE
jgi:flagellar assembly protein FliH